MEAIRKLIMWTIIILSLGVLNIILLLRAMHVYTIRHKLVARQYGMKAKYSRFIKNLTESGVEILLLEETPVSLKIKTRSDSGTTTFTLTQNLNRVTIQWEFESAFFGKHKTDWSFHDNINQEEMIEIVMNDIKSSINKSVIA